MKQVVEACLTFECGRCSNIVRRTVRSTDDGLIELPATYCGRCVGHRHFSQMSITISKERMVEEKTTVVLTPPVLPKRKADEKTDQETAVC